MGEAIWQGLLTGLVLSTFVGPIFFLAVDLGINSTRRNVFYLAFGSFLSDFCTILLIYFVLGQFLSSTAEIDWLYLIGGMVLVVIGVAGLLRSSGKRQAEAANEKENNPKLMVKGFLINGTNPNIFFFWTAAVMVAVNHYHHKTSFVLIHFLVALLVVLSTDFSKGFFASLLKPHINEKFLGWLDKVGDLIIIAFGLKLIFFH